MLLVETYSPIRKWLWTQANSWGDYSWKSGPRVSVSLSSVFPKPHFYGDQVHHSSSSREVKGEQLSGRGKSARPEKVSLFLLHRIIFLPCGRFMRGTPVAQGIMIPFCLIINSHRRLVPHIPADAARQSGCAGRRARHEVGSKGKLILLLLLAEVVS